ncbi:MAG: hypothetical protein H6706_13485 [Myxococcales bacterium]|nr:hypothetical protein [Myxococcales bacterium]
MRVYLALALALALPACDDDATGASDPAARSDGAVYGVWADQCAVELIRDVRAGPGGAITLPAGARYLLSTDERGAGYVELLFLAAEGGVGLEIEVDADDLPFTGDCAGADRLLGVFADTTVYADADGTDVLCELPAGTQVKSDDGGSHFLTPTSEGLDFSADFQTYQYALGALSARCGGAEEGFIRAPQVMAGGVEQLALPIGPLYGSVAE